VNLQWEKTNEISWRRNELRESKSTGGAVRLPVKKTKFPPLKPVDSVSVGMGQSSSECSMKEPNSCELWTEVVKMEERRLDLEVDVIKWCIVKGTFWNIRG
jgi:hypothetical protein